MSNVDKAAKVIDQWTQEGYELNSAVGSPHAIAERLANAGLLAPDLPEPDREDDRKGAVWYLNGQIGYIGGGGPVIDVYGLSHQRQSFRLTLTEEEAESTALTLLAAVQYAKEQA